jgi:O-antigen/teichoic acid export membrane protein
VGADVALLVIFPAAVIQFAIMAPISEQISNLTTRISVTQAGETDRFLKYRYTDLLFWSLISAATVATGLFFFAPVIESWIGGSEVSVFILRVAAIANVMVAVFMANSLFLIFLNKIRSLVGVALLGVSTVGAAGIIFAQLGFENIVVAYLLSAAATMAMSTILVVISLRKPASLFFARYM